MGIILYENMFICSAIGDRFQEEHAVTFERNVPEPTEGV